MSTLPPGSSPPPPPTSANPLPWEDRDRRGFLQSFVDTLGLFISHPAEAWARARETGDIASPLLFGGIISWVSIVVQRIIIRLVPMPFVIPAGPWARRFPWLRDYGHGGGVVVTAIFSPIAILCALFIGAAILHFCCMLVGALNTSASGFEGTFRATAYSHVASIASIIPGIGGLITLVWWIVLAVMGLQRMHRTTQGKAIAAIFIPVVLCCGVLIVIGLLAGAAILSRMSH
jgi:hypothetical protein